jgi:hypothetical protein
MSTIIRVLYFKETRQNNLKVKKPIFLGKYSNSDELIHGRSWCINHHACMPRQLTQESRNAGWKSVLLK